MSSFALKIIACIFMTIDHIGEFIPGTPIWLRWIGRLSFPLFLFCLTESYYHTSNRKKFLSRMYIASVLMGLLSFAFKQEIPNNIFGTYVLVCILISVIEYGGKDFKKTALLLAVFTGYQLFTYELIKNIPLLNLNQSLSVPVLMNIHQCEGGIEFVFLGVLMYFSKNKPLTFLGFSLMKLFTYSKIGLNMLFSSYFQWMMGFSAIFMNEYNGTKGKSMKYFFYIYYPLHIVVLKLISMYFVK